MNDNNFPTTDYAFEFSQSVVPIYSYDFKENAIFKEGYIATTYRDNGWYDQENKRWVRDEIVLETLNSFKERINSPMKSAPKVTYRHKQEQDIAGVAVRGSAEVRSLGFDESGKEHFGLWAKTRVNEAYHDFDKVKKEIENGVLDSFSIEYATKLSTGEYLPESFELTQEDDGSIIRKLLPGTHFIGWTLASTPMNETAVAMKEKLYSHELNSQNCSSEQEENKMTEQKEQPSVSVDELQAQINELKEQLADANSAQVELKEIKTKELESKEQAKLDAELKEKEAFEAEFKEIKDKISTLSESKESKVNVEQKEVKPEFKEFINATAKDSAYSREEKARAIGAFLDAKGFTATPESFAKVETKEAEFQNHTKFFISNKEGKYTMEYKSLGLGDNTNANYVNATTEIGLSQVELNDAIAPLIFDALNSSTVTYDLIPKENHAGKGTAAADFRLRTSRSNAYFSKSGALTQSAVGRERYQAYFKKLYVAGAIDGDLLAANRGSAIGDILTIEVNDMATDAKVKMNQALFDENSGNKANAEPLGIPAVTDSAGNTSLYDTTRSAANKLAPDAAGDTYISGSGGLTETLMAQMIEKAKIDGSQTSNLVFVGSPTVVRKYKDLFRTKERLVPMSTRVGFQDAPDFDGVPVFEDKDSKASALFLLDLDTWRIAIFVPLTMEKLGKRSDSEEFFLKQYYAVYCRAPRRNVELHSIA